MVEQDTALTLGITRAQLVATQRDNLAYLAGLLA